MKQFYTFSLIFMYFFSLSSFAQGNGGVGGGGVSRLVFELGKNQAIETLTRMSVSTFPEGTHPNLKKWFLKNHEAFLNEMLHATLVWTAPASQKTCATTEFKPYAQIILSYQKCSDTHTPEEASWLLMHEVSHHFATPRFNPDPENFADQVATLVARVAKALSKNNIELCSPEFEYSKLAFNALNGVWLRSDIFQGYVPLAIQRGMSYYTQIIRLDVNEKQVAEIPNLGGVCAYAVGTRVNINQPYFSWHASKPAHFAVINLFGMKKIVYFEKNENGKAVISYTEPFELENFSNGTYHDLLFSIFGDGDFPKIVYQRQ